MILHDLKGLEVTWKIIHQMRWREAMSDPTLNKFSADLVLLLTTAVYFKLAVGRTKIKF